VAYGLMTGILAVSAGVVASARLDPGGVRQLISVVTTLAVAALAVIFASRILGWVLPVPASGETENADNRRGDRDH
jgi:hypothetical protein